ncbi:hypothetical protein I7I48_05451 [Histoplasma ohiense]|nr:hypothetical protein I7I48_05451 [Histoplasma ohiense (nom. inval.)]
MSYLQTINAQPCCRAVMLYSSQHINSMSSTSLKHFLHSLSVILSFSTVFTCTYLYCPFSVSLC